jgi:prepilin-type N-terminal cleavage/methylation domain-containing protein
MVAAIFAAIPHNEAYMYARNKKNGFNLIELSIVITIMGTLLAGGIQLLDANNQRQSIEITRDKQERINDALITYFISNGNLPCPASPAQATSNDTYAQQQGSLGACTVPSGSSIVNPAANVFQGTLPTRTLGLSDEFMYDGWGNKFSYIVYSQNTPASNLEVQNLSGAQIATDIKYILISHGENGLGAYLRYSFVDVDGGGGSGLPRRNALPSNAQELRNSGDAPLGNIYYQNQITNGFDDITTFKTYNQMIYYCNKFSEGNCSLTLR